MSRMEEIRSPQPLKLFKPETEREQLMWDAMTDKMETALRGRGAQFDRLTNILNTELTFGNPNNGPEVQSAGQPISDNIEGQWVTVVIDDDTMLGDGVNSPVTFTHGLNVPVTTGGATGSPLLPNVRWLVVNFTYGHKGSNSGNPTPPAGRDFHNSVYFCLGDTVTADAIDLRVNSDLDPIDTDTPLIVEIFFQRAVI